MSSPSSRGQSLSYQPSAGSGLSPPVVTPGQHRFSRSSMYSDSKYPLTTSNTSHGMAASAYMLAHGPYDPAMYNHGRDPDDVLHDPDPPGFREKMSAANSRGFCNVIFLILIMAGILALFVGYPVTDFFLNDEFRRLIGGNSRINGSGQAPILANVPQLIDPDTPQEARTHVGMFDGTEYELVFSDEFNQDYRTFYPGEDPFWEAVDLWYAGTTDLQWYDPSQVTTGGGYLRIKLEEVADISTNHELGYKSGMLQTWNKFCFTGGYMEVRVQLPGAPTSSGYWPGVWTEGNLARPGFASTNDAMWPYSYDTCDIGTLPNQSYADRSRQPPAAFDLPPSVGRSGNNYDLSWLPGQRLSACTCPDDDHPGPKIPDNGGQRLRGRGAPEIDILEARLCNRRTPARGCATQSSQFAPFSALYDHDYTAPAWEIQAPDMSEPNYFKGSPTQQSVSCLVNVSDSVYAQPDAAGSPHGDFGIFGLEYQPSDDPASSYITWKANDRRSHTVLGTAVGPNLDAQIGQRIISQEPMAIILNLAISESFQQVLLPTMFFPAEMLIDYVRVYQRKGAPEGSIGCDPPNYPTVKYIQDHIAAYDNANYTTWVQAGFQNPRNRLIEVANGRQC